MERLHTALRTQAKLAQRAFEILDVLTEERDGLPAVDLVNRLDVPKTGPRELLTVLARRGAVAQVREPGQTFIQYRQLMWGAQLVMGWIRRRSA